MPTESDYVDFRMDGGKNMSAERQENNQGKSGEYGQGGPQSPLNGDVPADSYPNVFNYGYDAGNRMFSNDKAWEPQAQADEASGQSSTANDLIEFLNTSAYTMGSRVCHQLKEKDFFATPEKQSPAHPSGGQPGPGSGKTGPA
jgi:hypothetical protein